MLLDLSCRLETCIGPRGHGGWSVEASSRCAGRRKEMARFEGFRGERLYVFSKPVDCLFSDAVLGAQLLPRCHNPVSARIVLQAAPCSRSPHRRRGHSPRWTALRTHQRLTAPSRQLRPRWTVIGSPVTLLPVLASPDALLPQLLTLQDVFICRPGMVPPTPRLCVHACTTFTPKAHLIRFVS